MPETALQPPDTDLIRRAKTGELAAFAELVNRHERRVFTLARRITGQEQDAEDVTQQTFINALEHLDGFRGDASFSTWLLRIATYAALKVLRRRKNQPMISLDDSVAPDPDDDYAKVPHPQFIADWRESPAQLAQRQEVQRLIDAALAELDEKHRLVFLLRDVEGLNIQETAGALGITEANVKVRLLRARLQLRERLTQTLGDPARRLEPHRHDA